MDTRTGQAAAQPLAGHAKTEPWTRAEPCGRKSALPSGPAASGAARHFRPTGGRRSLSGSRFPLARPARVFFPCPGPAAEPECPRLGLLAASTAASRAACRCCPDAGQPAASEGPGSRPGPRLPPVSRLLPPPRPAPPLRPGRRALEARSRGRSTPSALRRRK